MQERTDTPGAALLNAAYAGEVVIISHLLTEGVDVNVSDRYGRTALSHAARRGDIEIIDLLIRSGAWVDPHEDYDTYTTPLIEAARAGRMDVVECLLKLGADPTRHGTVTQAKASFFARTAGYSLIADRLAVAEENWYKKTRK